MPSKSVGKIKITKSPSGRTKVETAKPRRSVSAKIGAEKKAARAVKVIEKAAPGRVQVTKRGAA